MTAAAVLRQPVLGVGRVVVVRRDDPLVVLEHHPKPRGRGRRRIEVDDFQVGAGQRILEVGEERLPLVVEISGRRRLAVARREECQPGEHQGHGDEMVVLSSSFIVFP